MAGAQSTGVLTTDAGLLEYDTAGGLACRPAFVLTLLDPKRHGWVKCKLGVVIRQFVGRSPRRSRAFAFAGQRSANCGFADCLSPRLCPPPNKMMQGAHRYFDAAFFREHSNDVSIRPATLEQFVDQVRIGSQARARRFVGQGLQDIVECFIHGAAPISNEHRTMFEHPSDNNRTGSLRAGCANLSRQA